MENRKGLVVDLRVEPATGYAERIAALAMVDELVPKSSSALTLGADAGYDTSDFVAACRERGSTPHIAQTRDARRCSAVDGRTTQLAAHLVAAAYNLLRISKLVPA